MEIERHGSWNYVGKQEELYFFQEELRCSGNEKCYQLYSIPDTESEIDSFEGNSIDVEFVFDGIVHNDVVRCS